MNISKKSLLEATKKHIAYIQQQISEATGAVKSMIKTDADIAKNRREDQVGLWNLRTQGEKRLGELDTLYKSPYFIRCDITFNTGEPPIIYYFAKHQFSDESIYSWVAPIAAVRFEKPGIVSYQLPNGDKRKGTLLNKEQYLIVDGKVIFFAKETIDTPRDLIYQEHFSTHKTGFMLPEIVAQMEKAQDQVIRAHHTGPLVIAGPAGSGKTTLAFHRVAYLVQAPDTSGLYPSKKMLIIVQDTGTKNYFSQLLPQLGITDVQITTFSQWAFDVLNIQDHQYCIRYGNTEEEKDSYEYEKLKALRSGVIPTFTSRPYVLLRSLYEKAFTASSLKLFEKQRKENKLDRFDLSIILRSYFQSIKVPKTKRDKILLQYPFILVDEFQNYLPEQLLLLKHCLDPQTNSMLYIGDMAQQITIGTIRQWQDIDESITEDRHIVLKKVYRNTKNILNYIARLGYGITIPEELREGMSVVEEVCSTEQEQIDYIKNLLKKNTEGTLGIIGKTLMHINIFKQAFTNIDRVHVLTMSESQGVEFDMVCLVNIKEQDFRSSRFDHMATEHREEKIKIEKDLLYVALTRAMNELHVLGESRLSESLKK